MKKTIRDLPMYEWAAYYDTRTDRIHNCTFGSRTWYHEDRHRWQVKKMGRFYTGLSLLSMIGVMFTGAAVIAGNLQVLLYSAAILVPATLITIIEEFDAEIYAWRKYMQNVPIANEVHA